MASAWRSSAPAVSPWSRPSRASPMLRSAWRSASRAASPAAPGRPFSELLHQLAQRFLPVGERPLVAALLPTLRSAGWPSRLAAAALPAGPPVAELALELLEAVVGEPLLLAERVGEALHRLLALRALALLALALPDHHLHVLEHLLEHVEERLGLLLAALLGELLDAVHQLLDLVLGHRLARRDLAPAAVRPARWRCAPSPACSRASPDGGRPSGGRSPRRWRRSPAPARAAPWPAPAAAPRRRGCRPRSAPPPATAPRRPRRAPRRPCRPVRRGRASASPSARRDRPRGCRRSRPDDW